MMRISAVLFLLFFFQLARAGGTKDSVIVIGIAPSAPFVNIPDSSSPTGISIDFWKLIAREMRADYEYKTYANNSQLLDAVRNGDVDMSINPISVSESRLKYLDFSMPFLVSGIAMVHKKRSGWLTILDFLFSWEFVSVVASLGVVILIFGSFIWVLERKKNSKHFNKGAQGLVDGFWWSAVTMTTVGYGDKAPVTRGGRAVAVLWMFVAIVLISALTASISSALTVERMDSNLKTTGDLSKFRVGTLSQTGSHDYLKLFGVKTIDVSNVPEGLQKVEDGELDVFVYDRPLLQYHLVQLDSDELSLLPFDLKSDYYSFSYQKGSKLRDSIDFYLIRAIKSPEWNYNMKRLKEQHL